MSNSKIVGIYKITSPSGRMYIGQSGNIRQRFQFYKNKRCKHQILLYNSLLKYGVENHKFEILIQCPMEELNKWEKHYISLYQTFNTKHGLNLMDGGDRQTMSDETRRKISINNKGKVVSQETRIRLREAKLKTPWSDEHRKNLSIAVKKRWEDFRKKGLPLSDITKKRISEALLGKPRPRVKVFHRIQTEATREKMRLTWVKRKERGDRSPNLGLKLTDEHRKKISDAHKGMKASEEAKKKMSDAKRGKKLSEERNNNVSRFYAIKRIIKNNKFIMQSEEAA